MKKIFVAIACAAVTGMLGLALLLSKKKVPGKMIKSRTCFLYKKKKEDF